MPDLNPVGFIVASISLLSIPVNLLLIYLTCKLPTHTRDASFILAIAIIELLSPTVGLSDLAITLTRGRDAIDDRSLCQCLGFFSMSVIYFQIIVSSLLAIDRMTLITKKRITNIYFIPALLSSIFYFVLECILGARYEFYPDPAKIICFISPQTSTLSAIAYYHFIIITLINILIIIYCYTRLILYTKNVPAFRSLDNTIDSRIKPNCRASNFRPAVIRMSVLISVYSLCMLGGNGLYLVENIMKYKYSPEEPSVIIINSIATALLAGGFLCNALLVIIMHTAIRKEFVILYSRLKRKLGRR